MILLVLHQLLDSYKATDDSISHVTDNIFIDTKFVCLSDICLVIRQQV